MISASGCIGGGKDYESDVREKRMWDWGASKRRRL